jgi:hypothetical protein
LCKANPLYFIQICYKIQSPFKGHLSVYEKQVITFVFEQCFQAQAVNGLPVFSAEPQTLGFVGSCMGHLKIIEMEQIFWISFWITKSIPNPAKTIIFAPL